MTKDELRVKILCMEVNMRCDLEMGIAPDLKELAHLTDMRRAFNESN